MMCRQSDDLIWLQPVFKLNTASVLKIRIIFYINLKQGRAFHLFFDDASDLIESNLLNKSIKVINSHPDMKSVKDYFKLDERLMKNRFYPIITRNLFKLIN